MYLTETDIKLKKNNKMRNLFSKLVFLGVFTLVLASCSRVEPNYEGVLMENYGRNGKSDFQIVTGRQWVIAPGVQLYQVPMFETSGDPDAVKINAKTQESLLLTLPININLSAVKVSTLSSTTNI